MLIGTPQRILQHAERGNLFYGDIRLVVLDEADTMFDAGFGPEVRALLKPIRSKAEPAGCVLVAATLSKVSPLPNPDKNPLYGIDIIAACVALRRPAASHL